MAHKEILKESCDRIWKLLDRLNGSAAPAGQEAKDAEQYHQLMSALADSYGIKMALEAEAERENGAAYRGGSYGPGWSGHWDPYRYGGIAYRDGASYGPGVDWDGMNGMSGAQRRDGRARYSRSGDGRRGASYGNPMVEKLEDMMESAPASERRHFQKVIEHVEENG